MLRMLFVIVARRDSELLHGVPSIATVNVLPPDGVGAGGGAAVNVTLKVPSVTDLVPVAPEPGKALRVNENVPDAPVVVSVLTVIVPLPMPTPACQPAAGLPTRICAFAGLSTPSVYVPVPAGVGVSAKLSVVLRELSVPPTDRMPFDNPAVTDDAVWSVPSTRNVSELPDDGGGAGFVGAGVGVGLVVADGAGDGLGEVGLLPPPQAPATIAKDSTNRNENLMT